MVNADDVRRVGLALPRTYEREVRGRWKLRVGLVASDPGDLGPWAAMEAGEWGDLRPLLHPCLHWADGDVVLRGRVTAWRNY